jgi:hypothetical protein
MQTTLRFTYFTFMSFVWSNGISSTFSVVPLGVKGGIDEPTYLTYCSRLTRKIIFV